MSLFGIVQKNIFHYLGNTVKDIQDIELSIPKYNFGDYSLNISFKLAKQLKNSPQNIANDLYKAINSNNSLLQASVLAGFINLKLSDEVLLDYFFSFLESKPTSISNKRVLVEYVSANPTGPLHIGHGRWAVIGDVLCRLLNEVGVDVSREFYVNDSGNQIHIFNNSVDAVKSGKTVPESGYGGYFVDYILKNNSSLSYVDFTIEYQKNTLKKLGCVFDQWFKESDLHSNYSVIDLIKEEFTEYVYEKDAALWFKSTVFGDDKDRVIQKENGDLTYFASDIVYHLNKITRGFDHLINIWGADHHGYIKRLTASIHAKNPNVQFNVILGQLVQLCRNGMPIKMSKRTGDLIELEDVINEIGVDAVRFYLIEKRPDQSIDFDLELAKQKSMDNPIYYIQYANARICSILKAAKGLPETTVNEFNEGARKLVLHGARYYDVLYDSALTLEPYKLAQYIYDLAKMFHSFYQNNPVIRDGQVSKQRLHIVMTVQEIIKHCSNILGISTPNKM